MSSTYNELEFARKITERKQSVLPIPKPGIIINGKRYNGKQPCISWKERISKLATDQELESWFNGEHKNNVAIIIEKSSFAIDIDGLKSKDLFWNKLVPRLSEELQNAIRNTMCTKTGGDGEHVLFEIKPEEFPDGISTKTYVSFSEHDEIKIKGNPSYLVERGLHETGNKYEAIRDVSNLVILSKDCAQELIKALQNLKLETDTIKTIVGALTPYYIKGKRDEIVFALSGYLHKSGTPENLICEIVAQLALETNDEEIKNRLQVVKETCKKPANSKEVSGSKRLNDVLQASKPSSGKGSGALDHVNTIADIERALVNLSLQEKTFKFKPKKDDDNEDDQEDQKSKIYHVVYKYSKDGISSLAEEVIVGKEVRFLQIEDDQPIILENIDLTEEKNIILKPHKSSNDQTLATIVLPYSFKNEDEIRYFIKIAKQKTIEDFFYMSESLWKKFLVAKDESVITFYTIDTIYSYFQDLFPTTHYDIIIGNPGAGKGAILVSFKLQGYRAVMASGMSCANLLELLGSVESCQVTLLEDEFQNIEQDPDKEVIYKIGYDETNLVPKTLDGSKSSRHNNWYYPYCFKVIAAEKSPESKNIGGLNDRMFRIQSLKGQPKILVKNVLHDIIHNRQNPKYKEIVSKIHYLRKLLLIYRLLHHKDIIEEVKLNIDGRALELTSPQIMLFNSNKLSGDKGLLKRKILPTLSHFLKERGELVQKTLEGVIYDALKNHLFVDNDKSSKVKDINGEDRTKYTISYKDICDKVKDLVDGENDPLHEQTFYSPDYGNVTHNEILEICRTKFLGTRGVSGSGNHKKRVITFDRDDVERIGKSFDTITDIEIIEEEEEDQQSDKGEEQDQAFWKDWEDREE